MQLLFIIIVLICFFQIIVAQLDDYIVYDDATDSLVASGINIKQLSTENEQLLQENEALHGNLTAAFDQIRLLESDLNETKTIVYEMNLMIQTFQQDIDPIVSGQNSSSIYNEAVASGILRLIAPEFSKDQDLILCEYYYEEDYDKYPEKLECSKQIVAMDPYDLSMVYNLHADDSLPPNFTLSSDGLISGFLPVNIANTADALFQFRIEVVNSDGVANVDETWFSIKTISLPNITYGQLTETFYQAGDYFGTSLRTTFDGTKVFVGAYNRDTSDGGSRGSILMYEFDESTNSYVENVNAEIYKKVNSGAHHFGKSFGIADDDGNMIVVGSPNSNKCSTSSTYCGIVTVFLYNGTAWNEHEQLENPEGAAGSDYFGTNVDVSGSGTRFIVSTNKADARLYVFEKGNDGYYQDNWVKLAPAGCTCCCDEFGVYAAISGDGNTVVAGRPGDTSDAGSAYIFRYDQSSWSQGYSVVSNSGCTYDAFGESVDVNVDGSVIVVGCQRCDGSSDNCLGDSGAIYIFEWTGTTYAFHDKIISTPIVNTDYLGTDVSISWDGTRIAVSAIYANTADNSIGDVGAMYVFEYNSTHWNQVIEERGTINNGHFGKQCQITGNGKVAIAGCSTTADQTVTVVPID
jgi:hypothetical protein